MLRCRSNLSWDQEADGLWLTCAFVCLAGFNGAYRPIPGFAMRSGATVIKQATKMQCEKKCTSEKDCRSFSYRMSDRTCIWSLSSLSFDPDFMFGVNPFYDATAQPQCHQSRSPGYLLGWET